MPAHTTIYYVYYYVDLTVTCMAILLHCVGLLAIYLYHKKVNQNLILLSLSLSEIIFSLRAIACNFTLKAVTAGNLNPLVTIPFLKFLRYMALHEAKLAMFILTLDRAICAISPLKYKSRMTRKRTKIMIFISWVIAIILGVMTGVQALPIRKLPRGADGTTAPKNPQKCCG